MAEKKQDSVFSYYIPLVLIAAFMLGCLSVALISVRENVYDITRNGSVSATDMAAGKSKVKKSPVYDDSGLKYRLVSAADLFNGGKDNSPVRPASAVPDSSSSQEDDTKEDDGVRLTLPIDHYINFVPHKAGCTAYLTFDDGPSENTGAILDILDYYNVKATFFVNYHRDMEDQYRAIVNQGHTIALHTYSHNYSKVYSSESAFFSEMDQISDYVYSVTGVRSMIIRFPGGSSNTISRKYNQGIMTALKKSVKDRGYVYQDWNVDSRDAEAANTPPGKLLENVRLSLKDHQTAVVLMHDAGKNTSTTVEALPAIIEFFYANGYAMEKMEMTTEEIHHNW